jgi:hypothetical protein
MHATPGPIRATALTLSASVLGVGALAGLTVVPAVASGGGDDVRNHGSCSGATVWKMKAKGDDGRIEVEAEIDSNKVGQTWTWKLKRDGALVSAGTSVTKAPSGSFSVQRRPADKPGTDSFLFRAVNPTSGEVCRATVSW